MKAARCAPTLCGGKPTDLAADTASHQLNFLAARLNGTESPPKQPAIRRMSVETLGEAAEYGRSLPDPPPPIVHKRKIRWLFPKARIRAHVRAHNRKLR